MSSHEDPRNDAQLIDACNAGDAAAFEALYHRHRDHVVRLAYRFTGDRDAALDVMQETFLYLLRQFPGFELRAKLTTYLYPVVKHTAIRGREKHDRAMNDPRDPPRRPEKASEIHTAEGDLGALLGHLSQDHREVLLLRFVDGFSLDEIATTLEIPVGTVKSRLHHAVAKLRENPATKIFFEK